MQYMIQDKTDKDQPFRVVDREAVIDTLSEVLGFGIYTGTADLMVSAIESEILTQKVAFPVLQGDTYTIIIAPE